MEAAVEMVAVVAAGVATAVAVATAVMEGGVVAMAVAVVATEVMAAGAYRCIGARNRRNPSRGDHSSWSQSLGHHHRIGH